VSRTNEEAGFSERGVTVRHPHTAPSGMLRGLNQVDFCPLSSVRTTVVPRRSLPALSRAL
jgi:hypothetical protein